MTRSQDAVAQSQTLAAQKSGRQQHDMQGPHVHEDAQAMEQIKEEEKRKAEKRIEEIESMVRKLEMDSWDREGAVEDMGTAGKKD